MKCETVEDVIKVVKEENVSFIQFWFTDVLGIPKSFAIMPSELDEGLTEGMGFDGSSIEGFARIELLQRAHSPQVLPDGSASRAAGSFNLWSCTHRSHLNHTVCRA